MSAANTDLAPIRLAVAVQKYYHPGQTFVNRHLQQLFGGDSCVVAERHYEAIPENQPNPVFYIGKAAMNAHDLLRLPLAMYQNRKTHFGYRIPYGNNRKAMIAYLRDQKVDAILSEFGSQSMLVADVGREMGLPVFCYFRGRDASYWLNSEMRVNAYKKVFENLAGVFAVSQFLLDNLAAHGISHPNAHVVPSGTDMTLFSPAEKDPNLFLAVGRLVDKKAPHITIRAFLRAAVLFPNARLEIIGGGPAFKQCEALIKQAHAENMITLHGRKDSAFIAERLSRASVFLQHSVTPKSGESEGLPSSIQEAMAAGCAVLSTNHAGIPELVKDHETGLLCDEFDEANYSDNILYALNHPAKIAKMGIKAREVAAARVDYRQLYAKVEDIIRASVEGA